MRVKGGRRIGKARIMRRGVWGVWRCGGGRREKWVGDGDVWNTIIGSEWNANACGAAPRGARGRRGVPRLAHAPQAQGLTRRGRRGRHAAGTVRDKRHARLIHARRQGLLNVGMGV